MKQNKEKFEISDWSKKWDKSARYWPYKEHSQNSWNFLFLQQRNLKIKTISNGMYTENRNCFQNLEDKKFNHWRKNQNI